MRRPRPLAGQLTLFGSVAVNPAKPYAQHTLDKPSYIAQFKFYRRQLLEITVSCAIQTTALVRRSHNKNQQGKVATVAKTAADTLCVQAQTLAYTTSTQYKLSI